MLILELAFTGHPERLAARPAHRERLARLHAEGRIVAAGPWADDSGAALIFDVPRTELDAIMAADPYYSTPGVRVVSIRDWAPVVPPNAPGAWTASGGGGEPVW
ncbi:YciI family protein [Streptomyces sp. CA-250714]|uniref:YciI family protein n=1 Tax=Streptomyces sp. CA-250714 TaxID=3240060 RepID=UPI003D8CA400